MSKYDIRFEDLWIDAGWYGECNKCDEVFKGDQAEHTGEWEVNKRVHPEEMKDVSDCAKDAGMKLMLWFKPERAVDGTKLTKAHPKWFLELPNDNNKILNYANDDALEYVCTLHDGYV